MSNTSDRENDRDDGLGCVFAAAFVGLLFVALALALNAFVLPPRGFAP